MVSCEKIYWQRPDGGTIDLTDNIKYSIRMGVDGRFMPGFDFVTSEAYNFAGQIVRSRKTKPREVKLPIMVMGTSSADMRANLRFLTDAFGQMYDVGKLKVVTDDSKTYMLNCYFSGGMTLEESSDTGSTTFRMFDATFTAYDPFWYNPLETELTWWDPTGGLTGTHVVYNAGDVDAWPIWTITGPLTKVVITHQETLEFISWTGALANAYTFLYIDTRPLNRSVLITYHTVNAFANIDVGSTLFPLIPGTNTLKFDITQTSHDANTWLSCRWVDKYYGV